MIATLLLASMVTIFIILPIIGYIKVIKSMNKTLKYLDKT